MLWEVDIFPAAHEPDTGAARVQGEAADLGIARELSVVAARGYLIQGDLAAADIARLANELLADPIVEQTVFAPVGDNRLVIPPQASGGRNPPEVPATLVHVLPRPGVMDPVAQSALAAIADCGVQAEAVRTLRKYWLTALPSDRLSLLCNKVLANDAIEEVVVGPLALDRLSLGSSYRFQKVTVPLLALDDEALMRLSREGQLYLQLAEMKTIQAHYRALGRDPSDAELETLAQTWSEHCSHKTLAGRVRYRDERGERMFENMLKETIFAATQELRRQAGSDDWCVSVFKDNAGVIRFDETNNVVFKVETHNHPSALEPYGGANTGLGGVIRDPLGTGMGAKPVCNTDVFCFAPPDTPADSLPPGVLHPKRVFKGVVSGVRDYGNRMGIPTVNGAIYFDPRYLGNPLVYCGNVGLLPRDKSFKEPKPGDLIVAVGGRTGRDGIHGATFSSAELTQESETLSGGAVQIGNAITEKMLLDVILAARDRGLYNAITDCGAGGFSSAVGEMGEEIGAEVWLEKAPVKYDGLSYTEIWISEAQERMVLAVPEDKWPALRELCASEGVEATAIGRFEPTGRLRLMFQGNEVADLSMEFLHGGRPPVIREATYTPPKVLPLELIVNGETYANELLSTALSSLNTCSKEWVIRQYDHEVQGGSVVKPLVGVANDGPSDAAVVRPVLASRRAIAVSCGMNPRYGDFDTYHMAASAIDEAVRNCVAVGADPARIAILDNFCWGDCEKPETLGSLVRAALACYDMALALGTPFISGKDSLNNEFRYHDAAGEKVTIAIPPSLLISAIGQLDDAATAVTMDLKQAGNRLYLVGGTADELGGSTLAHITGAQGGNVPRVDAPLAKRVFAAVYRAIASRNIRACHDLSEGGLAVAAAEMAFAGGLGARVRLTAVPLKDEAANSAHTRTLNGQHARNLVLAFSESNSRFLCEVPVRMAGEFERIMDGLPCACIGEVVAEPVLEIAGLGSKGAAEGELLIKASLAELKNDWKRALRW